MQTTTNSLWKELRFLVLVGLAASQLAHFQPALVNVRVAQQLELEWIEVLGLKVQMMMWKMVVSRRMLTEHTSGKEHLPEEVRQLSATHLVEALEAVILAMAWQSVHFALTRSLLGLGSQWSLRDLSSLD